MEREADSYGKRVLLFHGLSACEMGRLLEKMEAHQTQSMAKHQEKNRDHVNQALDYLSSHPATPERMHGLCEK
jgi:predicted Zn-dependent protease